MELNEQRKVEIERQRKVCIQYTPQPYEKLKLTVNDDDDDDVCAVGGGRDGQKA